MPESDQHPLRLREAWILCFILGVVMLNYPFLHIFNKLNLVLGIPLLVLYFLVGWPLSILVIFLFSRTLTRNSVSETPPEPPPATQPEETEEDKPA